jgi:hypothetical protein
MDSGLQMRLEAILASGGLLPDSDDVPRDADLQRQLEAILARFGSDTGTVHLRVGGTLILAAHAGLSPTLAQVLRQTPMGRGMAGLAAKRNAPVSTCDPQEDPHGDGYSDELSTGVIAVPMRDAWGGVFGALCINVPYPHSSVDIQRLMEEAAELVPSNCSASTALPV